ncbi:MAG TPA: aldo/keto reductase [Polyangia bacterium]|nr:aldo/keto reductase [Polyangia bacterium]
MRYRKLGQSNVEVSEVSLGCWTLGGLNWVDGQPNGWANVDEAEVARAIDYALDRGVNHFDNADVYGNGRAERMLARLLAERSKRLLIASKVGHFPGTAEHAYEPHHIRAQCEQSLVNLKRETIDLYYFHHGNFGPGDRYLDDAVAVMLDLRQEGKIRLIGQSAYSDDDFTRVVPKVQPDVLQGRANAMDTGFIDPGTPVRRLLDERKMSFVAFSPLAQGILLGKYRPGAPIAFEEGDHRKGSARFSQENLRAANVKVDRLKARFGDDARALARVALQYLLSYPGVACVIPGFRNRQQVTVNLADVDQPLGGDDIAYVRQVMTSSEAG